MLLEILWPDTVVEELITAWTGYVTSFRGMHALSDMAIATMYKLMRAELVRNTIVCEYVPGFSEAGRLMLNSK